MLYFSRWKATLITAICLLGLLYAAPNMWVHGDTGRTLPQWLPVRTVSLGLDLQGGAHLLIQVKVDAVIREKLEGIEDTVRTALRPARIGYTGLAITANSVTLSVRDPAQQAEAVRLIKAGDSTMVVETGDNGRITLPMSESDIRTIRASAVSQSIEIIRRRIDETGTREPIIQRQGVDRIIVQLPGVDDPGRIKDLIKQTAKLNFHLLDTNTSVSDAQSGRLPVTSVLMPSQDTRPGQPAQYVVQKRVIVAGDRLIDAKTDFQNGAPVVSFKFDTLGARRFGQATTENIGKPLAIVLDGKVISAPNIREPILGGNGQISGSFSTQEANDLSLLLRAGALPAPIEYLEERTVGPGLGQDSIEAGKFACLIGLALVVVFMIICYGFFGLLANIALFFNLCLLLALLSILQATLTLPGIAGIVLTMGMAVDSNVLIYERIREEIRNGRSPISALEAGFERAQATITDVNITHLISSVLLFMCGSGPVKGFAVTLSLGIITTLFTAVLVVRLLVVFWLRKRRPTTINI